MAQAVRHPRTPIDYWYCPACGVVLDRADQFCPKCNHSLGNSPRLQQTSPIPWYGSMALIVIGGAFWVAGAMLQIAPMEEAARVLVYGPAGVLIDRSFFPR